MKPISSTLSWVRRVSAARSRRGVALITVLAFVLLLSSMLVAYVAMVRFDLAANSGYRASYSAQLLEEAGLWHVVGQFQDDIRETSRVVGSADDPTYIPESADAMMPRGRKSEMGTLLRRSIPAETEAASPISTEEKALSGRNVNRERWLKPRLVSTGSAAESELQNSPPHWVYVTRGKGPEKIEEYSSELSDPNAGDDEESKFVIGRIAYTVYDTSGLIDINVAGYPSALSGIDLSHKGEPPYADLRKIFISNPDSLVSGWRNQSSAKSGDSYLEYVNLIARTNGYGYYDVQKGDQVFLNRQDLLTVGPQVGIPEESFPYVTVFSRALNSPTYDASSATGLTIYERDPINPKDVSSLRIKGEPLKKFPLSKLALLNPYELGSEDEIFKYFGLERLRNTSAESETWGIPESYLEDDATGTNPVGKRFKTLAEVAAEGRQPTFFEYLQAAILRHSIGYVAPRSLLEVGDNRSNFGWGGLAQHVAQIGANMIDQFDEDHTSTQISMRPPNAGVNSRGRIFIYGTEDLPYFMSLGFFAYRPQIPQTPVPGMGNSQYWDFWNPVQIWNPHGLGTGKNPDVARPTQFRIRLVSGRMSAEMIGSIKDVPGGRPDNPDGFRETIPGADGVRSGSGFLHTITFKDNSSDGTRFREPRFLRPEDVDAGATTPRSVPFSGKGNIFDENGNTIVGFHTGRAWAPNPKCPDPDQWNPRDTQGREWRDYIWAKYKFAGSVDLELQAYDPTLGWRTYQRVQGFGGEEAKDGLWWNPIPDYCFREVNTIASQLIALDPRTGRFGLSHNMQLPRRLPGPVFKLDPNRLWDRSVYFLDSGSDTQYNQLKMDPGWYPRDTRFRPGAIVTTEDNRARKMNGIWGWAINDLNTCSSKQWAYYRDADGEVRRADTSDAQKLPTLKGYQQRAADRPPMLNRPFRSVGDLSYVFRDQPFRTLNFEDENSGDFGVLDYFTLAETPVVAGRINPNSAPPEVLEAYLDGTATRPDFGSLRGNDGITYSTTLARKLTEKAGDEPFANTGAFASWLAQNANAAAGSKFEKEAPVRALAETSQLRTWNFMIDLLVQSGRFPPAADSLEEFAVESERRTWAHVAIDRFTGKIIDLQVEPVRE